MGVTWFRRGLQNLMRMPRLRVLVNSSQVNITAKNDAKWEEEAIAA